MLFSQTRTLGWTRRNEELDKPNEYEREGSLQGLGEKVEGGGISWSVPGWTFNPFLLEFLQTYGYLYGIYPSSGIGYGRAHMRRIKAVVLVLVLFTFDAHAESSRPNVVFILADDLGYGDLGSYGARDIRTPHLDRLAREGVRLTNYYSAGAVCTPTRVAFLTGRYQQRVGMEWANYPIGTPGLPTSETSVATMLKRNGYTTAVFGKWHVGGTAEFAPNAHGFDTFFGFLGPNVDFFTHREVVPHFRVPDLFEDTKPVEREGYMTDLITERSVSFIERQGQRGDTPPFFLYVSYNAPHWPFQPPDPDRRWEATPENRLEGNRKDYASMVESMDEGVGRILKTLADRGLAENTLVIFSSDNGGERLSRNAPFFNHKATLWEGGIRVPCVMRWPGQLPIGKTSEQAVITMDLTASILAATGTAPPEGRSLDGMDVLPILKGKRPLEERTFFWRIVEQGVVQKAVRKGRWKYVLDGIERLEMLFDLERDPGERETLFYDHPEVARELRQSLKAWEQDVDQP